MTTQQINKFKSPGSEYRGKPFWAWNTGVEKEELIRQIHIIKEMGLGGFFTHARVGLKTPYLSREWFDCIRTCAAESEKLGMEAWLYDEDRWPSGAAGGIVTRDPRFRMKMVIAETLTDISAAEEGNTLAWYAIRLEGEKLISYRRLKDPENALLAPGETFFRCYWMNSLDDSWFNNQSYLDTLNAEAVKKFLEVTHEAYCRECGDRFGHVIPGIFCDEPNCRPGKRGATVLPWTVSVPEKFQAKFGYDLLDVLPELFYPLPELFKRSRCNYYDLLTELFVTSYSKTIGDWCQEHGLQLTGHVLAEDTMHRQTRSVGAAMRFYEYMQAPGIDLLTEHWNIFNTVKQCVSVARQMGRKIRLSETYGCTGWDFPFLGHKALGDWLLALGINLRCLHLMWYSMGADAKRDYPASIGYQSPWYKCYGCVEDYFARINSIISEAEEIRDLLVIHPIESCWGLSFYDPSPDGSDAVKALDDDLNRITHQLLSDNLDFDFGDEELLSRHASVETEKIKVGKAEYRAVLLPRMLTIRSSTLKLLEKFIAAGGKICYFGPAPVYVDAVPSEAAEKIYAAFTQVSCSSCAAELALIRRVSMTDPAGKQVKPLLYHLAGSADMLSLFICNLGMEFEADIFNAPMVRDRKLTFPAVTVTVKHAPGGRVYELDPRTGNIRAAAAEYRDGHYIFQTSFDELETRLFVISRGDMGEVLPAVPRKTFKVFGKTAAADMLFVCDEPNVLVLDHADCRVDGKVLQPADSYILSIDDQLRAALGQRPRSSSMVQPWCREKHTPARIADVELRYTFKCREIPAEDIFLAVENPALYTFEINGKKLVQEECSWWCDRSITKLRLPSSLLKTGENILTAKVGYHENLPGLEAIYLLGRFGVDAEDAVTSFPEFVSAGDWCPQGFPYYSGNFTYQIKLDALPASGRVGLRIPEWRGAALGIRINGGREQMLAWPPFRTDITAEVKRDGSDVAEITVYGHRRNAFGPFYLKEKWPVRSGHVQFKTCEQPERQLVPCGLLQPPVIEIEA